MRLHLIGRHRDRPANKRLTVSTTAMGTLNQQQGEYRMKRYIIAATAALTSIVGIAVTATPALAHHIILQGVPSCADPAGGYVVQWRAVADADRDLTWTIDGVTKPDDQPFYFNTAHSLSGPAPSLTKTATWSNGITSTVTGTVAKPGYCPVVATTTTAPATTTTTGVPPSTTTTVPASPTTQVTSTDVTATSTTAPVPTTTPSGDSSTSVSVEQPTTTTVAVGLPPLPPTTEGDATSQAPGPPPVPPSGLPRTGLKRDTARLALGLCLAGFVLGTVRRVRRS